MHAHLLQSCPTPCNPIDCNLPGSSVYGISQARILEWVAISSSRGSSQPRDRTCISCFSCTGSGIFTTGTTREALNVTSCLCKCTGFILRSLRPDPPSPALLCRGAARPRGPPSLVVTVPLSEEMLAEGPGTRTAHRAIPPALLVGG